MMTNAVGNIEARVASGGQHINRFYGDLDEDVLRTLMSGQPLCLEYGRAAIAERHRDVDTYLHDVLGVTTERRSAMMSPIVA